ncbi:hypothetical protein ABZ477_06710 [Microbacterium sp. NPDC019599]|uniref:hypothetical protein n=1 Tax=Microbacterium sp. NPDC019599 TaxID=3154690 RepID=UPI0033DD4902
MKRIWVTALVAAIVTVVFGALVVLSWMVDETHFDRPSGAFDEFAEQVEDLPGVDLVDRARWVEAPTFSDPTSWMHVTVDEAGLPGLVDAACSTEYADAVTWSIVVRTPSRAEVSLHAAPAPGTDAGDARCPDFGFDAVRLVDELDRVSPGLAVQPSIWKDGVLTLVALEMEQPTGFADLLPLVERSDDLVAAAGLDADGALEINSANLGALIEPGENRAYLALLRELAEDRAVGSFWADGGGTPTDGVEKVQIVAPEDQHAAIEDSIRSSGLHIADLPVRFIEQ